MKLVATLIAGLFAVSAFAQAPAKKEEVKPAAPTASAPAPAKDAKAADKSAPAKKDDKKAEPAKK